MTPTTLPTITVTGRVVRTWKSTDGQEGCLLITPAGEELTLYGPLPPLQSRHTVTAEVQGRTVIRAWRVVREQEIALAFYGQIRDITRGSVLKIVATLGDDTHQLITERFASLQGIKGLPASGLKSMQTHARRQGRWYTTLRQLADLGLPPEHTRALIKAEGAGAVRVFQENPYLAVQHDVPLRVIDHAALAQGLSAFDPRRNPALAFEVVRRAGQEHGHTCLPASVLERELQDLHALDEDEAHSATQEAIAKDLLVHARGMHFLPDSHRTESRIADDVARLLTAQIPVIPVPRALPQLTEEQRGAVQLACLEALSVITGGPGTGKTTTLRALLETFEEAGLRTLLCAPTGKAASRMQASTGQSATTLHRLLGYDGNSFEAGLLQADAVIVDEVSMASNLLLGTLLRSVPSGARVVLVGDADQLPPIDPGSPLAALIRTVPTTRLTRIHRQAQDSPILTLAAQLISGEKPANSGVLFHPARTTAEVVELMERHVTPAGPPMLLTAGRAGPLGMEAVNTALQEALNPGTGKFRVGDPVVVNRNDHHSGLMNGMTGRVAEKGTILRCDFDGELHTVDGPELDLAYAMTIHRAQGSEWERVIVALSEDHERLLTRQLAYTAVTRAKRELIATGERSAWDLAAMTPARNRHSLLEALLRD